jgi:hypothetical protein
MLTGSGPSAVPLKGCESVEIVIPITPVGAIIAYPNIIKVKLDTVMDDSLRLSVIESFKGDLRPSASLTVPKHHLAGNIYPYTFKIVTVENKFDTLGTTLLPRRRIVDPEPIENFVDTFIIAGASKTYSGYDFGYVYAIHDQKAYTNIPLHREYGGAYYQKLEHLDDPETLQQMIKVVVGHIDSTEAGTRKEEIGYKQYIAEFLKKFEPENVVNSSLRLHGLEDLLQFDLNKTFNNLPLKDKIELSSYSEQLIRRALPKAKPYSFIKDMDISIISTEDLELAVKLFPKLPTNTTVFSRLKILIFYAILDNRKFEVRKKTVKKFIRAISETSDDEDDTYFLEKLNAVLKEQE